MGILLVIIENSNGSYFLNLYGVLAMYFKCNLLSCMVLIYFYLSLNFIFISKFKYFSCKFVNFIELWFCFMFGWESYPRKKKPFFLKKKYGSDEPYWVIISNGWEKWLAFLKTIRRMKPRFSRGIIVIIFLVISLSFKLLL